jgi:hypothetical protein
MYSALHHENRERGESADVEPPHKCPHGPAFSLHAALELTLTEVGRAVKKVEVFHHDGVREGDAPVRRPRCRKIVMLAAPLFAITSPGSSVDLAVRFNMAKAKGPPRVR